MGKTYGSGTRGWIAAAAATVLAVGGLTACGASGDSGKDSGRGGVSGGGGRESGAGAAGSAGDTPATVRKNLSRVASATGPVICWDGGEDEGWQAAAYDATFSRRIAAFSEKSLLPRLAEIARETGGHEATVTSLCGDEGETGESLGETGVSPVSPDGRRVAVEVETDDSDSPWHVGWLDLGTGKFTDITKASEKKGYSPEKHSDRHPGFAPDGSLWFLRGSDQFFSADEDGRLSPHRISLACGRSKGDDEYYRPVNSVAVTCPRTINPSGKYAASPATVAVGFSSVDGFDLDPLSNEIDTFGDAPLHGPFSNQVVVRDDDDLRGCTPLAWLTSEELLCKGPSNDFFTVRVDPSKAREVDAMHTVEVGVKAEIAPATENTILAMAVSADRESLYIASRENRAGAQVKLHRAGLTSPGDPEELGALPKGVGEDFAFRTNFQTGDFR
ncbi:hypothetical protein [Streptomyces cuspidosporus]|uniref:Lipoprotein n=1 Tax=Streptomyces cuspidosporus TaxID=66882 RepID=A0ABN3FNG1_9ACTN